MNWYNAYSADYTPFVITVRDGDRLTGIVPLAVDRRTRAKPFSPVAAWRIIAMSPLCLDTGETVVRELIRVYPRQSF